MRGRRTAAKERGKILNHGKWQGEKARDAGFRFVLLVWLFFVLALIGLPAGGYAENSGEETRRRGPKPGWSSFWRGGLIHQFDSTLNGGGGFRVDRFSLQAGPAYMKDVRRMVSLSFGYGYDGYSFSGDRGFAALRPWKEIHSFRVGLPVRWELKDQWVLFVIPSLRWTAEDGADFGDGATGGGFAGVSYRFGDRLTLGPGIGVVSQIEDEVSIFPALIINWKITDRLSLETGRGLGAAAGPGLTLNWKTSRRWKLTLGGRYEKLRFRLDREGLAPGGIGEDRSFPLYGGVTGRYGPVQLSLLGGLKFEGTLRLENRDGNLVAKEDYHPAGFVGFSFRARL